MTHLAGVMAKLRGRRPSSSFLTDLRIVLRERDFRRLFATRLISQTGDGVFTAGLGSYVFFNNTTFPDPASAAAAFAVLYLPYSLIGPFAGVFIDRWSRRQILVWSALLRALFVALTAGLVASGKLGVPLYIGVLLVLGVNRFFLSSLSAALPHVVAGDKLVMANAVSPTAGGIMASIGGIVGLGVHVLTGGGQGGSAITLLVGGLCYVLASLVARTMARDLLGPDPRPGRRAAGPAAQRTGRCAGRPGGRGPVCRAAPRAGRRAGRHRRQPLPVRDLVPDVDPALPQLLLPVGQRQHRAQPFPVLVIVSAVGYACAALITPQVTKRMSKPAWITLLLASAAVVVGPLGQTFNQAAFLVIGFWLNLAGQGVAICATTILQEQVDDSYRGRVFAFYDMTFNITFVAGAALSAVFMPASGHSPVIVGLVAVGFAVASAGYWVSSREGPDGGGELPSPASPAQRRSS